jgi:hypothetical protein
MNIATAESWKHLPPPSSRDDLRFEACFSADETEQLKRGLVPQAMEDKWFIYFEYDWLRFHRSWTGAFTYALRLERSAAVFRVAESWVSRDPQQYHGTDTEYDRRFLRFIIDAFLLEKRDVAFPMPRGSGEAVPGVVQHSYVGRIYPEHEFAEEDPK